MRVPSPLSFTGKTSTTGCATALDWDQLEDCGAYLRAPEPATLYRMHGNMTGAYRVRHLTIHNRVVLTNKTPIKTTGDGYMVAGGLTEGRTDNVVATAEMALEMLDVVG